MSVTSDNGPTLRVIVIRPISEEVFRQCIPSIVHVFRDEEGVPWSKLADCTAWVARRIERGFYITAAYDGETMVGYSEWIETYDMGRKLLYLGLMHVDYTLRGQGIGGALLADGEAYAKSIDAPYLRTMPEDERSHNFYRKHGFIISDTIYACDCLALGDFENTQRERPANVTLDVANTHEFVFGLSQSSGRHMYEVANHPPVNSRWLATTIKLPEGYLQLRYRKDSDKAIVLYWCNESVSAETLDMILSCGHRADLREVTFYFRSKYKHLFSGRTVLQEGIELEKEIGQKPTSW